MHIKVLGPGCARCADTEKLVQAVAAEKGGNITVEKVSDLKKMMALGVMSTPAVVVDGVVKCTGRVPTKEEVGAWIDGIDASASGGPTAPTKGCCCGGDC